MPAPEASASDRSLPLPRNVAFAHFAVRRERGHLGRRVLWRWLGLRLLRGVGLRHRSPHHLIQDVYDTSGRRANENREQRETRAVQQPASVIIVGRIAVGCFDYTLADVLLECSIGLAHSNVVAEK